MKTLAQYESELSSIVPSITLLGQLSYDQAHLLELRAALGPLFADSPAEGLKDIRRRYPLTFALYLVLEALYTYEGGDYWTGPRQALGLSGPHTADAGQAFRDVLRRERLPTFEHLGGHVHITPILAHAGIPTYCLDDFFDLLDRVDRRNALIDVPTLLADWAGDRFPVIIDRPAQRFLLYGGDLAEEFVERCLELWREGGHDAETLDLPDRVLDAYDRWRARHPPRGRVEPDVRLPAAPKLTFDPYGEGVAILLPPVVYAAARAPDSLTWRIDAGDRQRVETTYRRRLGHETEFVARAAVVNVLTVAPTYRVSALAGDTLLKSWTLDGPGVLPLLAFDAATGEVLADRQRENTEAYWITPGERQLVYPLHCEVDPQAARKLIELPSSGGDWASFACETWLLEPDGRLDLTLADGRHVAFRARNDPPPPRPTLDGQPLLAAGIHERFALYNGRPPDLRIPPGRAGHQPERWRIAITPIGAADPPTPRDYAFDALRHRYIIEGDLILPFDAPELLGAAPFGEFHVRLRGPYGRKADFDLRFAPGLRFQGYPRLHTATDGSPSTWRIIHPAGYDLTSPKTGVIVGPPEAAGAGFVARALSLAPDLTRAPLRLETGFAGANPDAGPDSRPALDFDLPVYRLRFGLLEPERPDDFRWSTTPLRLHPEALEDRHAALLRIELPPPPGVPELAVGWRLVDPDGRVLRHSPLRHAGRHPQTGLIEWLDAFRDAGRVAALELLLGDGVMDEEQAVTLAHLLPTLELGQVAATWQSDDDGDHLSVIWEAAQPARRRRLRLWPVDRPWASEPFVLEVADDATDCIEWRLPPGRLPAGDYLAEMVVFDPWDAAAAERPAPGAPHTFPLRPDDMAAALEAALARARRDELPAAEALAWVLYMARTDCGGSLARFNITLRRERSALTMAQLVQWADAVRALGDESAYRIVQLGLFDGQFLGRLAQLPEETRRAYLAHLPDGLQVTVYQALLPIATGEPRRRCLQALCRAGDETGLRTLLGDVAQGTVTIGAAVAALLPAARAAADFLFAAGGPTATELLVALLNRAPDERFIAKDNYLRTNAGPMRVTGIRNALTSEWIDICPNNGDPYRVVGRLWADHPGSELLVQIDLNNRTIRFLKGPVYHCRFTGQPACDHVFISPPALRRHYKQAHKMDFSEIKGENVLTIDLTQLILDSPRGGQ
ncbi:MAG: hypothetical protein KC410_14000 [Anaerolineales bacterium]|nr:hypothetical protein [Anaerolineales bacterium]